MIKQIAILGASCALSFIACDRQDIDPATDSKDLRTRELPATITVRERQAQEHALEDHAKKAEREDVGASARVAINTNDTVNANIAPRRAEASLGTVGDAKLDALATFEETKDGVAIRVRVEDAQPGTRSVRIYDRVDCDDLENEPLGQPFASSNKQGALGSVTIGASGKGTLDSKAFNSTLKPNDDASLLGKTIVVQERAGASAKAAGDPIACGVIQPDQGLADKAGRMTP